MKDWKWVKQAGRTINSPGIIPTLPSWYLAGSVGYCRLDQAVVYRRKGSHCNDFRQFFRSWKAYYPGQITRSGRCDEIHVRWVGDSEVRVIWPVSAR